ncbi:MAG: phytol kinase [Parcubacteria bacterium C7867-008]|nr:MAG: phytol kinase [Parcubacteria bacterium C7867-008]
MELLGLIFASSICILITEVLKRRFSLPASITRRVVHVLTAVVAAAAPLFVSEREIIIVSLLFAAVLWWSHSRGLLSSIHSVERKTFGEVWLPIGIAITAFLFLPNSVASFQFGVLIMGISDPIAGFVGETRGKRRLAFLGSTKSIEGSAAFFTSSMLLTALLIPVFGCHLLLIPLLLTILEFVLIFGLDNLFLPIAGAFLAQMFL